MTKKHFEAAARIVASYPENAPCKRYIAEAYANLFMQFNPLFNRSRFLKACGVE